MKVVLVVKHDESEDLSIQGVARPQGRYTTATLKRDPAPVDLSTQVSKV